MQRAAVPPLLTAFLLAMVGTTWAQEPVTITKPQQAALLAASGKQYVGILISLNSNEVKFQPVNMGVFTFPASKILKVQTQDRLLDYDAKKRCFVEATPNVVEAKPTPQGEAESGPFGDVGKTPPAARSEKSKTQTVVAEGVGADADKALRDAFRSAVQQVVGALVDSETLVKNDEVINDKVLTYSDGFIKSFKKVSEGEKDGLHRVKIAADVERRSLVAKLRAARVTVREVDGESLFGEIASDLDAAKKAKALLENALKDYPFGCLEGVVLGKPQIQERDDTKVKFKLNLVFRTNPKAYQTASARLHNTLKGIARQSGSFILLFPPQTNGEAFTGTYAAERRAYIWKNVIPGPLQACSGKESRVVGVALNTQINVRARRITCLTC